VWLYLGRHFYQHYEIKDIAGNKYLETPDLKGRVVPGSEKCEAELFWKHGTDRQGVRWGSICLRHDSGAIISENESARISFEVKNTLPIRFKPYFWAAIHQGDILPQGAVMAGTDSTGSDNYVGRHRHGCGKLCTLLGKVSKIKSPGIRPRVTEDGEILIIPFGIEIEWVKIRVGDPIPERAVYAGRTFKDGDIFPCRHIMDDDDEYARELHQAESGKLSINEEGKVSSIRYHMYWKSQSLAEVLCWKPASGLTEPLTSHLSVPAPRELHVAMWAVLTSGKDRPEEVFAQLRVAVLHVDQLQADKKIQVLDAESTHAIAVSIFVFDIVATRESHRKRGEEMLHVLLQSRKWQKQMSWAPPEVLKFLHSVGLPRGWLRWTVCGGRSVEDAAKPLTTGTGKKTVRIAT